MRALNSVCDDPKNCACLLSDGIWFVRLNFVGLEDREWRSQISSAPPTWRERAPSGLWPRVALFNHVW
jgi:hypothetical protein